MPSLLEVLHHQRHHNARVHRHAGGIMGIDQAHVGRILKGCVTMLGVEIAIIRMAHILMVITYMVLMVAIQAGWGTLFTGCRLQ